ncbi:MAG: class II aldolase/adducin family protein [Pirellulales bacterium]|nr:class II aldolase/adducin family protein [Pirellulales bacterium]
MANLQQLKEEICDIGRRIYNKGFAAGNDGNISFRLSEKEVLCTPTMISKGFMKPADLCIVDLEGNQISGQRKRSSEIRLHLTIMKARPEIKSVVHCHPPHATAFAVAREPIPQCVLPEVEVFLGDVPITKYETPGDQKFADTVLPYVHKSNVMILANHGTVSFGESVERAYWWTEILDAYCRILLLSKDLGHVNYLGEQKSRELIELKTKWGFKDARLTDGVENCDICANDVFRGSWAETGVSRKAFPAPEPISTRAAIGDGSQPSKVAAVANANAGIPVVSGPTGEQVAAAVAAATQNLGNARAGETPDQERLIQLITDRVMAALGK